MPTPAARILIQEAAKHGVTLWLDGEHLRYKVADGKLPELLRSQFQARKAEVIAELSLPVFERRNFGPGVLRLPHYAADWWREVDINQSVANGLHMVVKLTGDVTVARLEAAVKAVVSRHELLRMRAFMQEDIPCLMLDSGQHVDIDIEDLAAQVTDDPVTRLKAVIQQKVWAPLENGVLFRPFIIRSSTREIILGFVLHHYIADFCSCRILARELLAQIGPTRARGTQREILPLQYSDYLLGLNEWASGPAAQYRLTHWQQQMRDAPATCLPYTGEPHSATVGPLRTVSFQIDPDSRARLARVAANSRVTLLVVLLAAQFAVLRNILDRPDLVVTPLVSGREHPALLHVVGNTVNLFPLRLSVSPEMTVPELLRQVHEAHLLGCQYQVPWRLLLRAIAAVGASWVSPTFNLIPGGHFIGRGSSGVAESTNTTIQGVQVEKPPETGSVGWHSSHEMHVFDTGEALHGVAKYMELRYRREVFEEFVARYLRCLERIGLSGDGTVIAEL